MQARLISPDGITLAQIEGNPPPLSLEHRGDTYHLVLFDAPEAPFALYAHSHLDNETALEWALRDPS